MKFKSIYLTILYFWAFSAQGAFATPHAYMRSQQQLFTRFFSFKIQQALIKRKTRIAAQLLELHKQRVIAQISNQLRSLDKVYGSSLGMGMDEEFSLAMEIDIKSESGSSVNTFHDVASLPFKGAIRLFSETNQTFDKIQQTAIAKASVNLEQQVFADSSRGIIIFQCKTALDRERFIQEFMQSSDVLKTFNTDTQSFPFEILTADVQADGQTNLIQKVVTCVEQKNTAVLNVGVYYQDSSAAYAKSLQESLSVYSQDGGARFDYAQRLTSYYITTLGNACNSIREGNLAHAHMILRTMIHPNKIPGDLRGVYEATATCSNRLIHEIYHTNKNDSELYGSLKSLEQINKQKIEYIFAEYMQDMYQAYAPFHGAFRIIQEMDVVNCVELYTGKSLEQVYASYTRSFSELVFGLRSDLSIDLISTIQNNPTNKAIEQFVAYGKAKKASSAEQLLQSNSELARFPELSRDLKYLFDRDGIKPQSVSISLHPAADHETVRDARLLLSQQGGSNKSNMHVDKIIQAYETHAGALKDSGIDQSVLQRRFDAIEDIKKNGIKTTVQHYSLSPAVEQMLKEYGYEPQRFNTLIGHQLQHVLHQEHIERFGLISSLHSSQLHEYQKAFVDITAASHMYNTAGDVTKALAAHDYGHFALKCMFAVGRGFAKGAITAVENIVDDPFMFGLELVAAEYVAFYHVALNLYVLSAHTYKSFSGPNSLAEKWTAFIEPIDAVLNSIDEEQHWLEGLLEKGSAFVATTIADNKLRSGVQHFCKTLKKRTLTIASKAPDKAQQFGKAQQEIERKVRVTLKANNMQEFFEKFEFGRKIEGSLEKTKIRFQGQTVYQVTQKIPGTVLKKGDLIYLDALHKDHLEVFTAPNKFKTVLNLDGSVNIIKEKSAQRRTLS